MSNRKRTYSISSTAPQGYNKASRMVGGRVLTYRPSAPIRGSSRYNAMMRGRQSSEPGFVDLAAANYPFDTTGSITLIATVAQGASVNQRVGKRVAWKSIQGRGTMVAGTTTTVADAAFLIVYDRRPTGALPAITDILNTVSSTAMNNDANSGRFKILKRVDQQFTGNSTAPATGNEAFTADFFLSLKGLPCVYKAAATGAIADIEQGALYLVTVGNKVAGTTAGSMDLALRTRFLDV